MTTHAVLAVLFLHKWQFIQNLTTSLWLCFNQYVFQNLNNSNITVRKNSKYRCTNIFAIELLGKFGLKQKIDFVENRNKSKTLSEKNNFYLASRLDRDILEQHTPFNSLNIQVWGENSGKGMFWKSVCPQACTIQKAIYFAIFVWET